MAQDRALPTENNLAERELRPSVLKALRHPRNLYADEAKVTGSPISVYNA